MSEVVPEKKWYKSRLAITLFCLAGLYVLISFYSTITTILHVLVFVLLLGVLFGLLVLFFSKD